MFGRIVRGSNRSMGRCRSVCSPCIARSASLLSLGGSVRLLRNGQMRYIEKVELVQETFFAGCVALFGVLCTWCQRIAYVIAAVSI